MSVDRKKARAIAEQLRWNRMPSLLDAADTIDALLAETATPEPEDAVTVVIDKWFDTTRDRTDLVYSDRESLHDAITALLAKTDATRLHEARVEGALAMKVMAAAVCDAHGHDVIAVRNLIPANVVKPA